MRSAYFAPTPGTIADQLRQRLLALDYPSFARCVCVLLDALGYEEARPAGRQEWKGYNRPGGGGYDLEASLPGGLVPRRVVVQIKQYDVPNVHQRNVDELLGACLRSGASEAILVTTSSFSKVVLSSRSAKSDAASAGTTNGLIAPVRLIDGKELLGLMIRYRLGVSERGQNGSRRLAIDETFFKAVVAENAQERTGGASSGKASSVAPERPFRMKCSAPANVHVTVHISSRSFSTGRRSNRPGRGGYAPEGLQEDGLTEGGR